MSHNICTTIGDLKNPGRLEKLVQDLYGRNGGQLPADLYEKAEKQKITLQLVGRIARKLGVKMDKAARIEKARKQSMKAVFSKEEDELIRNHFSDFGATRMKREYMPDKTARQISYRAEKLGVGLMPWGSAAGEPICEGWSGEDWRLSHQFLTIPVPDDCRGKRYYGQ